MSKKVLITGSEGFVGGHLWKELEKNGYDAIGTSLVNPAIRSEKIFVCDITSKNNVDAVIQQTLPDFVVHLAAAAKPAESLTNPEKVHQINVEGTKNIFDAIREYGINRPRILLIGSSEEFGSATSGLVTEETPPAPVNPYGESKMQAWKLAQEYIQKYQLDIVSAIPFNHTGPGQGHGFIAPDVASQIVEIERGLHEPILMTGNVSHKRNFSDVRDVVKAYRLLLEMGKRCERYIVCAKNSIPLSYLVSTLIGMSSVKIEHRIDPNRARPADVADISASHDKITLETGWEPEIPIERTLKDLLDWYRQKR